jgi:hypothetical protein
MGLQDLQRPVISRQLGEVHMRPGGNDIFPYEESGVLAGHDCWRPLVQFMARGILFALLRGPA